MRETPPENRYHPHNPGKPPNRCKTCGYLPDATRHQVTTRNNNMPVHTRRNLPAWLWAITRKSWVSILTGQPKKN